MASVATAVAVSAQSPKCSLTWVFARHERPLLASEFCLQTHRATAVTYHRSGELAFPQRNREFECMQLLLKGWQRAVEMRAKGLLFRGSNGRQNRSNAQRTALKTSFLPAKPFSAAGTVEGP